VSKPLALMVLLVVVVLGSFSARPSMALNWSPAQASTITIDTAVQLFENYLTRLGNPDLALHEVEEYQNNFYASYFEKSTGIFAFQMLIWKPGSIWTGGMMGSGFMAGIVMPEPGPNMMWNTKYGVMGGMMSIYRQTPSSPMTITAEQAKWLAQQYLDTTFPGKTAGDADTYYGYYNVDVLNGDNPFGMLSVNGYTGQVWYHSWHGTYIQTVEVTPNTTPVPEFGQVATTLIAVLTTTAVIVLLTRRRRMKAS